MWVVVFHCVLLAIISKAGDEITEPFGVDFSFVLHNYRGLFTIFLCICYLMIHIFILLPCEGCDFFILNMNYNLECSIIPWNAGIRENFLKLNK